MREHLVQVGDEPMLVCVAAWRERGGAPPASPPPATAPLRAPASALARDNAALAADPDDPTPATPEPRSAPRGPAAPLGALRADFTPEQQRLHDNLRTFRRNRAYAEGVPPYIVLTNRQLVELALQRPRSRQALGGIPGLGDKKIARFGGELLQALWPDGGPGADQTTCAGEVADAPTPEAAGDQPPAAQA
ncbi:MAG: hypothetical protein FJ306_00540 [Planctomycetes bacterium]|nr:hypothetical protein [Planctomycetota bacterium]